MPNKNSLEVCKSSAPKQDDAVTAHFIGAAVLLAAAAGFLAYIFALDRVFDFSLFAY